MINWLWTISNQWPTTLRHSTFINDFIFPPVLFVLYCRFVARSWQRETKSGIFIFTSRSISYLCVYNYRFRFVPFRDVYINNYYCHRDDIRSAVNFASNPVVIACQTRRDFPIIMQTGGRLRSPVRNARFCGWQFGTGCVDTATMVVYRM